MAEEVRCRVGMAAGGRGALSEAGGGEQVHCSEPSGLPPVLEYPCSIDLPGEAFPGVSWAIAGSFLLSQEAGKEALTLFPCKEQDCIYWEPIQF